MCGAQKQHLKHVAANKCILTFVASLVSRTNCNVYKETMCHSSAVKINFGHDPGVMCVQFLNVKCDTFQLPVDV